MLDKNVFAKGMGIITAVTVNLKFEPIVMEAIYETVKEIPEMLFMKAISDIVKNEVAIFPTTNFAALIRKYSGLQSDLDEIDSDNAREAAERIVHAVSRYGWSNLTLAKEYIGELGWKCVEMQGGWQTVCSEVTHENQGFLKAQYREYCRTLIHRGRKGILELPPAIPRESLENKDFKKLTDGIGKEIK